MRTQGTHVAAVVYEARQVAALCGVDDGLDVHSEQVGAADADLRVVLLPPVGHDGPHHLAHILNDHLVSGNRLQGKQAPVVDAALGELELLLPELRPNECNP